MVQNDQNHDAFMLASNASNELFQTRAQRDVDFPIHKVDINWDRLMAKRGQVLLSSEEMPAYLLKPEILRLLEHEKDPTYRLIMDLMWSTGARISEVLALTPERFVFDRYDHMVILDTLKKRGRPKRTALQRSPKRFVPICEPDLINRISTYLYMNKFKKGERIFTMARQTVNRHIKAAVDKAGGAPFPISCHTFRHSFAIHLLLHGRPLKYVSQLLGHSSVKSTEIYTNVLTVDGSHFMEGIDFH